MTPRTTKGTKAAKPTAEEAKPLGLRKETLKDLPTAGQGPKGGKPPACTTTSGPPTNPI
jgi:hypothetical protein